MSDLINKLFAFIATRPGFDFGNYGDVSSYRADVRKAGQQLADARVLLRACEVIGINPDLRAFSGRLSLADDGTIDYCTGQYYPLEYRAAVAACCASALWVHVREAYPHFDGNGIRKYLRNWFGAGIARRYFN